MSTFCRYRSRRRRLPTRPSRPRRVWWSCLCCLRCSVRSEIRFVSIATWASAEPVSVSCRPYSVRISFFCSVVSATGSAPRGVLSRARPAPNGFCRGDDGTGRHGLQPDPIDQSTSDDGYGRSLTANTLVVGVCSGGRRLVVRAVRPPVGVAPPLAGAVRLLAGAVRLFVGAFRL